MEIFAGALKDALLAGDVIVTVGTAPWLQIPTFISAAEVNWFPFTSLNARKRTYAPCFPANDTTFSVASLANVPLATAVPQFIGSVETYISY